MAFCWPIFLAGFCGAFANTGKTSWYSKGWPIVSFQPTTESPEPQYFHHHPRLQPLQTTYIINTYSSHALPICFSSLSTHKRRNQVQYTTSFHGFHPVNPVSLCNVFANAPWLYLLGFFCRSVPRILKTHIITCRELSTSKHFQFFPVLALYRNFATTISSHAILCFLVFTCFAQPYLLILHSHTSQ